LRLFIFLSDFFLTIASLHLTILTYFSELCDINSQLSSQVTFIYLYSAFYNSDCVNAALQ